MQRAFKFEQLFVCHALTALNSLHRWMISHQIQNAFLHQTAILFHVHLLAALGQHNVTAHGNEVTQVVNNQRSSRFDCFSSRAPDHHEFHSVRQNLLFRESVGCTYGEVNLVFIQNVFGKAHHIFGKRLGNFVGVPTGAARNFKRSILVMKVSAATSTSARNAGAAQLSHAAS